MGDKSALLGTETANLLLLDMADDVLDALPVTRETQPTERSSTRKNPCVLYKFLPTLFAMDVTNRIAVTGNKLIVMFDNCDDIGGRGDDGLIFMIPDTLRAIAGRNKLYWSDGLVKLTEGYLIF